MPDPKTPPPPQPKKEVPKRNAPEPKYIPEHVEPDRPWPRPPKKE